MYERELSDYSLLIIKKSNPKNDKFVIRGYRIVTCLRIESAI